MVNETTEVKHTRCVRTHYPGTKGASCNRTRAYKMRAHAITPGQRVSYVTELEHTRCLRIHYPRTKGVSCNRTRACKMRALALPQDKGCVM